jgi:hypothetical protein
VQEEACPDSVEQQPSQNVAIPDSIDEQHNISGTTFLPTDSELETGDLDPLVMLEAFPTLDRAADSVLGFLVPSSSSPADILETVKGLQDPKTSHSKRFDDLVSNFDSEAKHFSHDTYIDVARVSGTLSSLQAPPGSGPLQAKSWHVSGFFYKSNCARLAIEIFAAANRKDSLQSPLYGLEGTFPSPFLCTLVSDAKSNDAGQSSLRRATFDLALDLRTHLLKLNLQMHKNNETFDPNGLLTYMFFNEGDDVSELRLRGFNIATLRDGDGSLPSRFQDDVYDRVNDIRRYFRDDTKDPVDFEGLEIAFPWSELLLNAAKWIRIRQQEISRVLCQQPGMKDQYKLLEQEINRRSNFGGLMHAPAPAEAHRADAAASPSPRLTTSPRSHPTPPPVAEKEKGRDSSRV